MSRKLLGLVLSSILVFSNFVLAGNVEYLSLEPLTKTVSASVAPVADNGSVNVPLITWGGDMATLLAKSSGIFDSEGLKVSLYTENDFRKQVEDCLSGKTPYLRGTMGMVNSAVEVLSQNNIKMSVVYQMTWSVGGDALVVRGNIKSAKDLRGRTIALQRYGPHMDYLTNVLWTAGIGVREVKLRWLQELTLPTRDTGGKTVDPVSAFREDSSLDAIFCIVPDALALSSNGTVGTGSEQSVKGARILMTTKTASRIIADVYAVRQDYLAAHHEEVSKFAHALLRAEEAFADLVKNKSSKQAEYTALLSDAANTLFGAPQATADAEGLIGVCEFVGYPGNVTFFTGRGTTRNFDTLNEEIQKSFVELGLLSKNVELSSANWNWQTMSAGLSNTAVAATVTKQFDADKLSAKIESKIAAEASSWDDDKLFDSEINFAPNEQEFSVDKYAGDFKKALGFVQTYAGAVVAVEGHSDPLQILKDRQAGVDPKDIAQKEQVAKNLSVERARAVRTSFLAYCRTHKYTVDDSRLVAVGRGIDAPKFNPPKTKQEWAANRRVRFLIKNVEAEASEFTPVGQ